MQQLCAPELPEHSGHPNPLLAPEVAAEAVGVAPLIDVVDLWMSTEGKKHRKRMQGKGQD